MAAIVVDHVSKILGPQLVLNDVSIECGEKCIVGITGRNGSGKSVLFKCICGLILQDIGTVTIKGQSNTDYIRSGNGLGAIIEEPAFLDRYSGRKNLELLYSVRNRKDREHINMILEKVGLDAEAKKRVGKYSMGMKQRLAIAQAIMEDQEVLLLDEPMNGLDNAGVEDMRKLFLELREEGKTILLASHNKEDISCLCDCVYEMDAGTIKNVL